MIAQYAFLEPQISNIFKRSAITEPSMSPTLAFNATETMTSSGMYAKLKVRSLAKYLFSQLLRDRHLLEKFNSLARTYVHPKSDDIAKHESHGRTHFQKVVEGAALAGAAVFLLLVGCACYFGGRRRVLKAREASRMDGGYSY